MSGLVKFGEKSKNVKPTGNHPYYFLELKRISDRQGHVKAFSTDSAQIPKTGKFCMSDI